MDIIKFRTGSSRLQNMLRQVKMTNKTLLARHKEVVSGLEQLRKQTEKIKDMYAELDGLEKSNTILTGSIAEMTNEISKLTAVVMG